MISFTYQLQRVEEKRLRLFEIYTKEVRSEEKLRAPASIVVR